MIANVGMAGILCGLSLILTFAYFSIIPKLVDLFSDAEIKTDMMLAHKIDPSVDIYGTSLRHSSRVRHALMWNCLTIVSNVLVGAADPILGVVVFFVGMMNLISTWIVLWGLWRDHENWIRWRQDETQRKLEMIREKQRAEDAKFLKEFKWPYGP